MKKPPNPNLIERAIAAVSPQWALRRHQSRVAMAATGGYVGAEYRESLAYWQPGVGDADSASVMNLRELRARSRDLVRNSPIAAGAIQTKVAHVVGTGLMMQPQIDAAALGLTPEAKADWQARASRLFSIWAESPLADAMGEQTFYELQDLAYRTSQESGDGMVVLAGLNRPQWPFRLALQIIEADRVSNPEYKGDTEGMVAGIEKDASGAPVAAHICNRHPGQYQVNKDQKWTRIAFRSASGRVNLIHLKKKLRPGQTRGIPELAPIIDTLKQLSRYSTAEVDAAVNSASLALFAKMDPEAFEDLFNDEARNRYIDNAQRWDGTVRSGTVVNLLPGEDISNPIQNRPNPNFDPFMQAFMGLVGIGLGIPKEVLTKHFQSSYSAARAALLDAWRTFRIERTWLASKLCQPVYEEWLADAVAAGQIEAPGFFADPLIRAAWCGAKWNGDGPGSINPEVEAKAARERISVGITTLAEEIVAYDGGDWASKHQEQAAIQRAREDDGLATPVAMQPGSPGQAPQGQPPGQNPGQ